MARLGKWLWWMAFLLPVIWQLWVPPYFGLANNGDFAKVIGRFSLGPAHPSQQDTFHFFIRQWHFDPAYFWVSPYWGIEVWLTQLALWIGGAKEFDIRWLGLVHAAIFAVTAALLAGMISNRWWLGALAVAALTDIAYVSYFQSFYFDAAALVFGLLFLASWFRWNWRQEKWVIPIWAVAGISFALAKGPHSPAAIGFGLLLLATRRRALLAPAALTLAAGVWMLSQTSNDYKATAFYNLTFYKLGILDPAALPELGVKEEYRKYIGTHAFEPNSPAQNPQWLREFFPQNGYANAIRYYVYHPGVLATVLWRDLAVEAKEIRAENLGNYERETGKRYCTLAPSFGWWSGSKSWLFRVAPWHLFLLVPAALALAWRNPSDRWLLAGVVWLGGYEFAVASLADACETHRHLLLFHLAYDWLLILAAAGLKRN